MFELRNNKTMMYTIQLGSITCFHNIVYVQRRLILIPEQLSTKTN